MDETSMDGIEEVRASEIYPKKPLESDDSSLTVPFPPLPGEGPQYLGSTTEGTIVLSNYRLYLSEDTILNIPLGLIEQVECRDIFYLYIYCKDARSFRCIFPNNDECQKWFKRLQKALLPPNKLDIHNLFGFAFYLWSRDEHKDALFTQLHQTNIKYMKDEPDVPIIYSEAERMSFDLKNVWKISKVNIDYKLCPSYPRHILVPASIHGKKLEAVANFRYSRRIPAVVWRHQQNGCVIARCSQPEVGWLGNRRPEDEDLIQAIADACISDPGCEHKSGGVNECYSLKSEFDGEVSVVLHDQDQGTEGEKRKLLIIDARSYAAALANRVKGGGCECTEYYPNCEVQFLSLANIHSIRKSFSSIRTLCNSSLDPQNWLSSLESTKWLQHIAGLITAGLLIVNAVDVERRPVLVHCSDGWDRTPQIVALAELMMDPFYRSRKGFQVLVEKEWLEFSHKFADRCGHSTGTDDLNERSPVFLQWLDCVHQLLNQFPCYFEFNQQFLVKLVHHTYSCLFGTFLCNTDQDRRINRIPERTFSVWSFLNESTHFHNYLFNNSREVLRPSCQVKDLKFWSEVYLPTYNIALGKSTIPPCQETPSDGSPSDAISLVKTKSCDNISSIDHSSSRQRRCSDPNIVENVSFGEDHNTQLQSSNEKEVSLSANADCITVLPCQGDGLDTNGNPSVNGEKDSVNENCERTDCKTTEVRSISNLTLGELTIDGSTDTLVSENGIIHQTTVCTATPDTTEKGDVLVTHEKLTSSVSTSTSGIPATVDGMCEASPPNMDFSDSKWSAWCQSVMDAYISNKKTNCSSGSCSRSYATPHHSRTPSSGFPATPCDDPGDVTSQKGHALPLHLLDIDGLMVVRDEIQEQIQKLICHYKSKVENLEYDLWAARNEGRLCHTCQGKDGNYTDGEDRASLADSACSGEQRIESSAGSDISWEQLDQPNTTLWVPDHAVSHCTGCGAKFWTGKRKHHCRKCGRVFCSNCSSQVMPVPTEQLFHPVRVCVFCFEELHPQCRQSVVSCDKLPKAIITAAST